MVGVGALMSLMMVREPRGRLGRLMVVRVLGIRRRVLGEGRRLLGVCRVRLVLRVLGVLGQVVLWEPCLMLPQRVAEGEAGMVACGGHDGRRLGVVPEK
jgi:hypothetical protein